MYPSTYANIADFQYFIQNVMDVPVEALPLTSPDITTAFCIALDTVNPLIKIHSLTYYNLAVYNFAGDYLINWANDQMCSTYFEDLRKAFKITSFVAGVVASTADVSTSTSLKVPDSLGDLTLFDLQLLKTPYGRAYLAIAQKFGSLWGLS